MYIFHNHCGGHCKKKGGNHQFGLGETIFRSSGFIALHAHKKTQKMPPTRKTPGVGARASALAKMLHPSEVIRNRFPNMDPALRLQDLVMVGEGTRRINRREQGAYLMRHDDFPNVTFHCVKRFVRVDTEGAPEHFFTNNQDETNAEENKDEEEEEAPNLPGEVTEAMQHGQNLGTDEVARLAQLIEMDDDNAPAPENVPNQEPNPPNAIAETWGHDGICDRRQANIRDVQPSLSIPRDGVASVTILRIFETLFMKTFIVGVLIPQVNSRMGGGEPVTYGEFLRWIGIWLLLATTQGAQRRAFWSTAPISPFRGAKLRFNHLMSRTRFEAILSSLKYTDRDPPNFVDKFFEVRQMIEAFLFSF